LRPFVLKYDTAGTLEAMRRVMNNFAMPAINEFADGRSGWLASGVGTSSSEDIYYREVYLPVFGLSWCEPQGDAQPPAEP